MSESTTRPAKPGELCTCGHPAVVVYPNGQGGQVGHCGVEGAALHPVLPCPWCGSETAHKVSWGDPAPCPSYALRPPEARGIAAPESP